MCDCSPRPAEEIKVFSAITLPTTYQSSGASVSDAIECRSFGQYTIIPVYDAGAAETANVCEIEISVSADGTNWSIIGAFADAGSGQMNFTQQFYNIDQAKYEPITFNVMSRYIRFRVKEEGVASNAGTLTMWLYCRPLGH